MIKKRKTEALSNQIALNDFVNGELGVALDERGWSYTPKYSGAGAFSVPHIINAKKGHSIYFLYEDDSFENVVGLAFETPLLSYVITDFSQVKMFIKGGTLYINHLRGNTEFSINL